jgi:hypothetical protein
VERSNLSSAVHPVRPISFRLTESEYALLQARIASSEARSFSKYVRSAALQPIKRYDPPLVDLVDKLHRIQRILTERKRMTNAKGREG